MSTVFYGYRIPKSQFWDFAAACREYYAEHSALGQTARALWQKRQQDSTTFWDTYDQIKSTLEHWESRLQLFDFDDSWIFRVLESSYFFMNKHEEIWPGLVEVYYDSRTDVSPEEEINLPLVDQMDVMVHQRRYLLYSVITVDDFWSDRYIRGWKKDVQIS